MATREVTIKIALDEELVADLESFSDEDALGDHVENALLAYVEKAKAEAKAKAERTPATEK